MDLCKYSIKLDIIFLSLPPFFPPPPPPPLRWRGMSITHSEPRNAHLSGYATTKTNETTNCGFLTTPSTADRISYR